MNAWSNKARVRGTALFALHELERTDRTGFEVRKFEAVGKLVMSRDSSLKDKMVMAALLAIEELEFGSNTTYKVERGRTRDEIIVFASYKLGPSLVRDEEVKEFMKFGLQYKGGVRNGPEGDREFQRTLRFGPSDARDLLRA